MAKSSTLLLLLGIGLGLTGCQMDSVSDTAPAPSFGPPTVIASAQPVRPLPVRPIAPIAPIKPIAPPPTAMSVPRDWIPDVPPRPWKYIIIHHSDTATGCAARFDAAHRAKGWDELGYDFVIGNGTESGDGQIEVGPRWPKQKWGAHDKTPDNRYNDYGIGICLVGNFDQTKPTEAQMRSLAKIVAYMMKTYHISPSNVLGHGDTKPTDCPGKNMSVATVRTMAEHLLAESGEQWTPDPKKVAAGQEMLESDQN